MTYPVTKDEGTTSSDWGPWSPWSHEPGKGWGYLMRCHTKTWTHRWLEAEVTETTDWGCEPGFVYTGSECVWYSVYYGEEKPGMGVPSTRSADLVYHTKQGPWTEHSDSWPETDCC